MESDQNFFSFNLDGKELIADVKIGEVLEIQSHSETRVSGSGGGGRIDTDSYNKVSGTISSVNISSKVFNETKVWVKTSDALEDEWVFPFAVTELSIRAGHKIGRYIICNSEDNAEGGHSCIARRFINFTTGRMIEIASSEYTLDSFGLCKTEGFSSHIYVGAGLGLVAGLIIGNTVSPGLGFFVFILGLVGGFIKSKVEKTNYENLKQKCYKQLEEAEGKVMELIASNKIPTAVAYFKAKKGQKS